jgi:predicted nucleotidyltransferase
LILFGSYANLMHTKESDIDLLYIGNLKEIEIKRVKEFGKKRKIENVTKVFLNKKLYSSFDLKKVKFSLPTF